MCIQFIVTFKYTRSSLNAFLTSPTIQPRHSIHVTDVRSFDCHYVLVSIILSNSHSSMIDSVFVQSILTTDMFVLVLENTNVLMLVNWHGLLLSYSDFTRHVSHVSALTGTWTHICWLPAGPVS